MPSPGGRVQVRGASAINVVPRSHQFTSGRNLSTIAIRYPVLWISFMSLVFWLFVRDKPADLGLPDDVAEDTLSSEAETRSQERLHGLQPYLILLRNWRFGVDLAARKISGTASGLLDAQAYLYNGLQALIIGWILDATGGN
jgi:sugar phosphate permease